MCCGKEGGLILLLRFLSNTFHLFMSLWFKNSRRMNFGYLSVYTLSLKELFAEISPQHTCLYHLWGDSIKLCEDNKTDRRKSDQSSSLAASQLSMILLKKKEKKTWTEDIFSLSGHMELFQENQPFWNALTGKWSPWGRRRTFLWGELRMWPCACSLVQLALTFQSPSTYSTLIYIY